MPDPNTRVFVVWEPVLAEDTDAPSDFVRGRIPDARVAQYWDRSQFASKALRAAFQRRAPSVTGKKSLVTEGDVVWDAVLVFQKGTVWNGDVPPPAFTGAPVRDVQPQLAAVIRANSAIP